MPKTLRRTALAKGPGPRAILTATQCHTLLRQFEAGARVPDEESAARLKAALEEAGVTFTAGGVRLRPRPLGGVVHERLNAEKDG